MPHVLDLDRDVSPGPFEGKVDRVLDVVYRINAVCNGFEFFLSGFELG